MATESNYESQRLSGDEALTKVRGLLKHFRGTMMVTTVNGKLPARPMGMPGTAAEFDGVLWFFTDRESGKVEEIEVEQPVPLIFQSDSEIAYLHLFGKASVILDSAVGRRDSV